MMDPTLGMSTVTCSKFKSYVQSLGITVDDRWVPAPWRLPVPCTGPSLHLAAVCYLHSPHPCPSHRALENIFDLISAQTLYLRPAEEEGPPQPGQSTTGSSSGSGAGLEPGFTEEDFLEYILNTYVRSKRPIVFE
jgi:hypothetical protein